MAMGSGAFYSRATFNPFDDGTQSPCCRHKIKVNNGVEYCGLCNKKCADVRKELEKKALEDALKNGTNGMQDYWKEQNWDNQTYKVYKTDDGNSNGQNGIGGTGGGGGGNGWYFTGTNGTA